MSESKKDPDGSPSKPDGEGDKNKDKDLVPRGDHDEAIKRRDAALKRAQEAEDEIARIKREKDEAEAVKAGDIEKLRNSFSEQETKLKGDLTKVTGQLKDYVLKAEVKTILAEITVDPDTAFLLVKDEFEVVQDDLGNMLARPKNSTLQAKDFISKKLEGKDYLLKNKRAEGAGTGKTSEVGAGTTEIPSDFASWDYNRKKEWMSKNPKLAGKAAVLAMGG